MLWLRGKKRETSNRADHAGPTAHAVRLVAVSKVYRSGGGAVPALDEASIDLTRGSAEQNITLPVCLAGRAPGAARLREVASAVGIAEHLDRRPSQFSGGQQQRVAIACALIARPGAVFADEPTGALDTRTGRRLLRVPRHVVDTMGQTALMVTHDPVAASFADSVVFLADRRLAGPSPAR